MVRHLLGHPLTGNPAALETRASIVSGAPTKSVNVSLVSDRDRHLFLMGTEDNDWISPSSTQNKMFIRFSNQEDINTLGIQQQQIQLVHSYSTKEMKSLERYKVRIMS
jgi:hypothetical protein